MHSGGRIVDAFRWVIRRSVERSKWIFRRLSIAKLFFKTPPQAVPLLDDAVHVCLFVCRLCRPCGVAAATKGVPLSFIRLLTAREIHDCGGGLHVAPVYCSRTRLVCMGIS